MSLIPETVSYNILKQLSHSKNRMTEAEIATHSVERGHESQKSQAFLNLVMEYFDYRGKIVLDIGSGYGDLCLSLVNTGAARAVGIDVDPVRVGSALRNAKRENLETLVHFEAADFVHEYIPPAEGFDLILSQDAFEHILDPLACLQKAYDILKPGGSLVTLFGPLWRSPYGAHMWEFTRIPWVHFLFPESVVLKVRAEYFRPDQTVKRYEDIVGHLNRMTVKRFEWYAQEAGFSVRKLRVNPEKDHSKNFIYRNLNALINVNFILRELGSQLLLAILDKPKNN